MHAITNSGWIEVVTGSMFSGKTEELLRRLRRAEIAGQSVAAFTPAIDDRFGEATLGSHGGRTWAATVVDNTPEGVAAIPDHLDGERVVAIDEANFFPVELVEVCQALAADDRRVIVAGIDLTFRGEPFEPVPQVMAVAEYVDKLQAICTQCGEPATRTQRLIDGEPAHVDDPTIMVGAEESYEARCRHCHVVRTDADAHTPASTESDKPTERADSTEPAEPTDSTEPPEPTDSTEPPEPTDSTEPPEPTEPTN